jgi:hypothetical protein
MNRTMSKMTNWYAAAALAAGMMVAPAAFAQDAGLTAQQQAHQAAEQKKEQQHANKAETKAERREEKHEREQLANMPKPVRETLKAETANATHVDYYKAEGANTGGGKGHEFGAKFTNAQNHQMDIRVDRDGKVISRQDLTGATAAAQAPATAAQQPATATPTTPAPGSATASTQAPPSGDPMYRRLQANEVPANIRTVFDQDTKNGRDVHYYRTKYGNQLAYEAKWTDANGKDMKHYVSDAGTTLVRGEDVDNDNATTAGSKTPATPAKTSGSSTSNSSNTNIKTGRTELNQLPKSVQTQVSRLTEGASNVDLYNTKYGDQQAYEAKYTTKAGKHMAVYFDKDGKVLSQKEEK